MTKKYTYHQPELWETAPESELPAETTESESTDGTLNEHIYSFFYWHGFERDVVCQFSKATHTRRIHSGSYNFIKAKRTRDRLIEAPNPLMRAIQKWLLNHWEGRISTAINNAACGIQGRGLHEMVEPHRENRYFFKCDISDAYAHVDASTLSRILGNLDLTVELDEIEAVLKQFCFGANGLATGALTSPLLFNLYMSPLDSLFAELDPEISYTRYMDDIVFSSQKPIGKRRAKTIKDALREYGFRVNQHKVRYHNIEQDGPFMITGLQLNPGGSVQVADASLRNIRRLFEDYLRAAQEPSGIDIHDIGVVRGYMGFVKQFSAHPRPGKKAQRSDAIYRLYHQIEQLYRAQIS